MVGCGAGDCKLSPAATTLDQRNNIGQLPHPLPSPPQARSCWTRHPATPMRQHTQGTLLHRPAIWQMEHMVQKTRAGGSRPRPPARQGRLDCMQMVSPKTRPMCPMSNTTPQHVHDAAKASIPSSTSPATTHDPHPQRRTTTPAVSNSPIQMPTCKDGRSLCLGL